MNAATDHTAIYANGRTYAEHGAWLDSLTGHDWMMVHTPIGHLFNLAFVAYLKRVLLTVAMTADERMKALDGIASAIDGPVTAAAIEAIEPACATAVQMMHEISKVQGCQQMRTFADGGVFRMLAELNPSLLRALELCQHNSPVPQKSHA